MDKKSILIGAFGASLLFITLGAGINSSEQTTSEKWQFYPANYGGESGNQGGIGHLLNTENGALYFVDDEQKEPVKNK